MYIEQLDSTATILFYKAFEYKDNYAFYVDLISPELSLSVLNKAQRLSGETNTLLCSKFKLKPTTENALVSKEFDGDLRLVLARFAYTSCD